MSECKCGKEGCDGTVCMCGTSCGCESMVGDFQEILNRRTIMPLELVGDVKGVSPMVGPDHSIFKNNEEAFLQKIKELEDAQDALAQGSC